MDIDFRGITKTFNGDTVLDNISLKLPSGSFNVLRGPNGSGKTTLIEIIAGILKPEFGDIYFGSIKMNDALPFERRTFYIPQTLHKYWHLVDERLFCFIPERTVQENIEAALISSGRMGSMDELLDTFDLKRYRNDTPEHLSFGLQQRLAIARAFLSMPNIILMDEPLSAVDEELKPRIIEIIKNVHYRYKSTILYVTHNFEEARMYNAIHYSIDKGRVVVNDTIKKIGKEFFEYEGKKQTSFNLGETESAKPEIERYEKSFDESRESPKHYRGINENSGYGAKREQERYEKSFHESRETPEHYREINENSGYGTQSTSGIEPKNYNLSENNLLKFVQRKFDELSKRLDRMEDLISNRQLFQRRKVKIVEKSMSPELNPKIMIAEHFREIDRTNKRRKAGPKAFSAPVFVTFDITHYCNLSCIHCSSDSGPHIKSENGLSASEAVKVIDQLANAGVAVLSLSGGEPLLRKDWHVIAKHAVGRGMIVNIETNGSTINTNSADLIKKTGINCVSVSLESHRPEIHDKIRQCEGLFWRTIRAIHLLADRNVKVGISFTPTKHNWMDADEVIELACSLGASSVHLSHYIPIGRGKAALDIQPEERRELLEKWIVKQKRYKGKINLIWHDCRVALLMHEFDYKSYIGCGAGSFTARILPDGTLTPCAFLPMAVGSLRATPFQKLWNESDLLKNFRERNNLYSGNCRKCEYIKNCGGCRASAYAYSNNDPLAGDRQCWVYPFKGSFLQAAADKYNMGSL